jgi:hypothetical protein
MSTNDFTTSITAAVSADEAFSCINQVTAWWTENLEGESQQPGDVFTVRFGDVHVSTQKLVEVIPGKKVVWLVTGSHINFVDDKQEWTNTRISFDIMEADHKTTIRFTHHGLRPQVECYDDCSVAWSQYIQGSLFKLLTTGKGTPTEKEH